jgi:hypothetical protein
MTSLNEIVYNILNLLRGGRTSNTDHLSLEQIKYMVKYYRAVFLRRDQERNLNRSSAFEQELGFITLESVDPSEVTGINSGEMVYKTSRQIPKPLRLKRSEAITYVSVDNKVGPPLSMLDSVRTPWQRFNKYTSDKPFVFIRDNYLYVTGDFYGDKIYVRGIFEDPEAVFNFAQEDGIAIYDEDSPFPISGDMLEGITKSIVSGELQRVRDIDNDTDNDTLQGEQ